MSNRTLNKKTSLAVACWMSLAASCAQTAHHVEAVAVSSAGTNAATLDWPAEVEAAASESSVASDTSEASEASEASAPRAQTVALMTAEPAAGQLRTQSENAGILDTAYFKTPEFKRRFANSFLSVSDVEPGVTPEEAEELQEIIELIQQEGKRERALTKLQGAINDTSSANYPYLIGQIHQGEERYDLALEAYLDAVDRTPTFRRAWQQIALLYYRRALDVDNENPSADYTECARAFARAISLGLVDETSYGMMAASLLNSDHVLAAETAFRMAIMMGPGEKQWTMGLAQCYFRSKRYAEAVGLLDDMIADDPDNATLWMFQGNAYLGLDQPRKAARDFQVVDQLGGGTGASTNILADIYANDGLFAEAVPVYLKALELDEAALPDRAIRAAKMMTGRGDVESAKTLLAGVESHFGDELPDETATEVLKLRAKIAVREGRGEDEIEVLRQIVDRNPLDGDGLILLADALSRNDKIDEALQMLETAASIESFEAEAKLQHARVLVQQKRFAEAIPLLKSSLQLNDKESVQQYLESVEKAARTAAK
ncbi:tetratricopeptide repeat protein [Saltatorellus ferox]